MIKKLALSAVVLASSLFATGEVNVYSHRHYDSDKILFNALPRADVSPVTPIFLPLI